MVRLFVIFLLKFCFLFFFFLKFSFISIKKKYNNIVFFRYKPVKIYRCIRNTFQYIYFSFKFNFLFDNKIYFLDLNKKKYKYVTNSLGLFRRIFYLLKRNTIKNRFLFFKNKFIFLNFFFFEFSIVNLLFRLKLIYSINDAYCFLISGSIYIDRYVCLTNFCMIFNNLFEFIYCKTIFIYFGIKNTKNKNKNYTKKKKKYLLGLSLFSKNFKCLNFLNFNFLSLSFLIIKIFFFFFFLSKIFRVFLYKYYFNLYTWKNFI